MPALGKSLARVRVPLAAVTAAPDPASEQVTQVLLWDAVEVLTTRGEWSQVIVAEQYRTERGYPGWMRTEALAMKPSGTTRLWVAASYPRVSLRARPDTEAEALMDVFMGTRLPVLSGASALEDAVTEDDKGEPWVPVALPTGERAWVRARQVQIEREPTLDQAEQIVEKARRLDKTPYLWGGMSRSGIDCSGLIYVAYRMNGVTLPRDADQQYLVGDVVAPEDLLPGDLVFFGDPGEITHVGIYAGDGHFLHASSGSGVTRSILFQGWYKEKYRGARRILKDSAGGTRVLTPGP